MSAKRTLRLWFQIDSRRSSVTLGDVILRVSTTSLLIFVILHGLPTVAHIRLRTIKRNRDLQKQDGGSLVSGASAWRIVPRQKSWTFDYGLPSKQSRVQGVSQKLLALVQSHPANLSWPPAFDVTNDGKLNASASLRVEANGRPVVEKGKLVPYVAIDQLLLDDVIEGDDARLAFVLGHELAHLLLGHVFSTSNAGRANTRFLKYVFTRDQEIAADLKGMELALGAGYSVQGARDAWKRINSPEIRNKYPGLNYSSFEGLGLNHPSWDDRLQNIDKEQASLWKAMSASRNGTFFLTVQQYPAATQQFKAVTSEFPKSYEAWANLGYSQLMQYVDTLTEEDLRNFNIGQLVPGGFYLRPTSLEKRLKGIEPDLWFEAVGSLRRAIALKQDLTLAQANLGVAMLVRPIGKDTNQAVQYLDKSLANIDTDGSISDFARAVILINGSVAKLANGDEKGAANRLSKAERLINGNELLLAAVKYNRALLLANSGPTGERQAISQMEAYLQHTRQSSMWWGIGYDFYVNLCRKDSVPCSGPGALKTAAAARLRPVSGVEFGHGQLVTLSDSAEKVKKTLGPGQEVPGGDATLTRLVYQQYGSDLLVRGDLVAIQLYTPMAPPIIVQPADLAATRFNLRVGMAQQQFEGLLPIGFVETPFDNPDIHYRFYPAIGVAVRFDHSQVSELLVSQIPFR